MHFEAVLKVSKTCCVTPVDKIKSTLPVNITSLLPAGTAYESLYAVKSLALGRAIVSIYKITK